MLCHKKSISLKKESLIALINEQQTEMELTDFVLRILVAAGAGMLIGLERQLQQKTAGLRTNTLVALGASLFVLISIPMHDSDSAGDATRVVGQIVTGIGFLGAGVIIHQGVNIRGLTTAATIWCSSAVGCLAATGRFLETAIATGFIIVINVVLRLVDIWVERKKPSYTEEIKN